MPVPLHKLAVGRCYKATNGEVRQIAAFDGEHVKYVIERNGMMPVWNKMMWLTTRREDFAAEAEREVLRR